MQSRNGLRPHRLSTPSSATLRFALGQHEAFPCLIPASRSPGHRFPQLHSIPAPRESRPRQPLTRRQGCRSGRRGEGGGKVERWCRESGGGVGRGEDGCGGWIERGFGLGFPFPLVSAFIPTLLRSHNSESRITFGTPSARGGC
jgi:hypothetical protein